MSAHLMPPVDQAVMARRDEIVAALTDILGPDGVIASEDERRVYETDALTAYRAVPLAVVLPASTEEVSAALKYCGDNRIKVVARGAGTSLSGGRPGLSPGRSGTCCRG
jgi:glycolate oxidase